MCVHGRECDVYVSTFCVHVTAHVFVGEYKKCVFVIKMAGIFHLSRFKDKRNFFNIFFPMIHTIYQVSVENFNINKI